MQKLQSDVAHKSQKFCESGPHRNCQLLGDLEAMCEEENNHPCRVLLKKSC